MRLFVAATVPDDVRAELLGALGSLRDDDRLAWTRPDGWHATLAFLGEVEGAAAEQVADVVRRGVATAGSGPTTVRLGAPRTMAGRSALVLALHDEPEGALARLGQAIQQAVAEAGLPVQQRAVRPHLTLGRARRRRPVPDGVLDAVQVPRLGWTVDAVAVVESVQGAGPASYPTRASVPLVT